MAVAVPPPSQRNWPFSRMLPPAVRVTLRTPERPLLLTWRFTVMSPAALREMSAPLGCVPAMRPFTWMAPAVSATVPLAGTRSEPPITKVRGLKSTTQGEITSTLPVTQGSPVHRLLGSAHETWAAAAVATVTTNITANPSRHALTPQAALAMEQTERPARPTARADAGGVRNIRVPPFFRMSSCFSSLRPQAGRCQTNLIIWRRGMIDLPFFAALSASV